MRNLTCVFIKHFPLYILLSLLFSSLNACASQQYCKYLNSLGFNLEQALEPLTWPAA